MHRVENKMTLLQEIQAGAVDGNTDLPTLLRKCRILAARLKNEEFKRWVQHELDGYPPGSALPDYRKMPCQSFGHFSGFFGSGIKNAPIPLRCIPQEYRYLVTDVEFRNGVGALQNLMARDDGHPLQEFWPADLIAIVASDILDSMNLMQAWKLIPPSAIVRILETVRNRILSFVLEIESASPDAGEGTLTPALTSDKVSNVFNTYIMGNVGNLASGSSNVHQQTTFNISTGDWAALERCLKSLNVDESDIKDLKDAVDKEPTAPSGSLGKRVSDWVGKMISKSAQGLWDVGVNVASNILTKLISQYYGLPIA
jgi:hypothetical protein